jgi:hypothetical protein
MTTKTAAKWEQAKEQLARDGWQVSCSRVYLAEARRAGYVEQATGETEEEAFARLCRMKMLRDSVEGCR